MIKLLETFARCVKSLFIFSKKSHNETINLKCFSKSQKGHKYRQRLHRFGLQSHKSYYVYFGMFHYSPFPRNRRL
jgi:hypothetical protein